MKFMFFEFFLSLQKMKFMVFEFFKAACKKMKFMFFGFFKLAKKKKFMVEWTYEQLTSYGDDKFVLMTEACNGYLLNSDYMGPRHGEWAYGYAVSHDILWQLRLRGSGWVFWNIILDKKGGPNLAGNYVDSPSYQFNETHVAFNPSFFHMMHFSRFIPPGSKVIDMNVKCEAKYQEYCQWVAVRTPDNQIVVVITNDEIVVGPLYGTQLGAAEGNEIAKLPQPRRSKGQNEPMKWSIECSKGKWVKGTIPWHAIQTIVCPSNKEEKDLAKEAEETIF